MKRYLTILILGFFVLQTTAQKGADWQQHVDYTMEIDMDVKRYQFDGQQKIVYTNNSPDELKEVFYHLQFNAFQPGSEMDIRLQNIADPDQRMSTNVGTNENPKYESRIAKLGEDEIGYQSVLSLKQNGKPVDFEIFGSIMKVNLHTPIASGKKSTFEMEFKGQVPVQIRRSGRNSKDGVALSMAQWYPKIAEYDFEGWHANAYLGREFHGVWGDFEVTIHIDKDYTIGGTGYLQNPQEVGHGYEDPKKKLNLPKGDKLTWHFKAPGVHDFTWAADPDYIHDKIVDDNGVELHFLYKNDKDIIDNWKALPAKTKEMMNYYNRHIGPYPYQQYSVIQGGDGGMEYGMCTLVSAGKSLPGLISVTAHELAHSWFQFVLATNETRHGWMDEGFTEYITYHCMNEIMDRDKELANQRHYSIYFYMVKKGMVEPLTTFSDRYASNGVYSISAYYRGSIFLSQLGYIIGQDNLNKTLLKYYADFQFRHPTPNDFKRTAEKVSGIQLEWYLNAWTRTVKQIDYAVKSIDDEIIVLENKGSMPMPLDIKVEYDDGSIENFNIPLQMMYGQKPTKAKVLKSWSWVDPNYTIETGKKVKSVQIDPNNLMADTDRSNNEFKK